jgi:hypothetical protein
MTYLVVLALMLTAFAVVSWPLLDSAKGSASQDAEPDAEREELLNERDSMYRAIKELDFDYELGNLSSHDYESLRERYRSRAAAVLHSLDRPASPQRAKKAPTATGEPAPIPEGRATAPTEAEPPSAPAPAPVHGRFCSTCGKSVPAGDDCCWNCGAEQQRQCPHCSDWRPTSDIFCGKCGTSLETE